MNQAPDPSTSSAPPGARPAVRPDTRIGMVVSTYHGELTEQMAASARRVLLEAGVREENLLVLRVPGAFEIPLVARRLALRDDVHAVLCLGLVLKGETQHDEHIARECAGGIRQISLETDKPILFGVLTCERLEQARARCRAEERDKGGEVARSALQVLEALRQAAEVGTPESSMGFGARAGEQAS